LNEDATVFALKTNGKFTQQSPAMVLELSEEELKIKTNEIADLKCPVFCIF
jgi:hypothetical protein